MPLHLVNKAPPAEALRHCLKALSPGSAVVLIEEGVIAAQPEVLAAVLAEQGAWTDETLIYALREDLAARNIEKIHPLARLIGIENLIELACHHRASISWN